MVSEHGPHWGNHDGYACGFSGPHCWACGEPWPCRAERGVTTGPALAESVPAPSDSLRAAAWYDDAHGEVVLLSDALDALEMVLAESVPVEPLTECWFCKGAFPIEALIAGYDTFDEQRLACLTCNERMQGNWRPTAKSDSISTELAPAASVEAVGLDEGRLARAMEDARAAIDKASSTGLRYRAIHDDAVCLRDEHGCGCLCHAAAAIAREYAVLGTDK